MDPISGILITRLRRERFGYWLTDSTRNCRYHAYYHMTSRINCFLSLTLTLMQVWPYITFIFSGYVCSAEPTLLFHYTEVKLRRCFLKTDVTVCSQTHVVPPICFCYYYASVTDTAKRELETQIWKIHWVQNRKFRHIMDESYCWASYMNKLQTNSLCPPPPGSSMQSNSV